MRFPPRPSLLNALLVSALAAAFALPAVAAPPLPAPKPEGFKRLDATVQAKLVPARRLFKRAKTAAPFEAQVFGRYARGCLAGGVQLPENGPGWQAMRLSRNRHWGHPRMIALIKQLARDATQKDGWPGLLVGDIAMPRGGPMWPSHASHQGGIDADIWLTPMPDRILTRRERENTSAVYMLTKNQLSINPRVWTSGQERLIKRAATYREVERVLVHPAIKKQLCQVAQARGEDTSWLSKVRPVWGHNYHFHIRMRCPIGSPGCTPQNPPPNRDGCGRELDVWYKRLEARLKPLDCRLAENANKRTCFCRRAANKGDARCRRKKRQLLTMADLPKACSRVIAAN
ncbi:MAG: penicillin-insensitive murein endopeptidase [Pseudomonadota bacterium]